MPFCFRAAAWVKDAWRLWGLLLGRPSLERAEVFSEGFYCFSPFTPPHIRSREGLLSRTGGMSCV